MQWPLCQQHMMGNVQSYDGGQLKWADKYCMRGAVWRGVRGNGGEMQCTRMRHGRNKTQCMGLHGGEVGGGGGRRRRGLHCTGMMNMGVGCITSESVRMHEVEVLCETIARWV